jgi:uncharacterized membrane protein
MEQLILSSAFFLLIHLLVSGTRWRDAIVASIGEGPYMGLFSLASIGGIVWMAASYNAALRGDNPLLWDLGEGLRHAGGLVMLIAFLFVIPGLLAPNPTAVGQASMASRPDIVTGMLRITRHPFLWGVAIWAGFHLAANGDVASALFFGTFLILAVLGTFSIDAKRQRLDQPEWRGFAAASSNIPLAAILEGRNRLVVSELLGWRQLVAILMFLAVMFTHHLVFGVSPFPGSWLPF